MTQLMLGSDKQAMHDTIDREFDAYQGARDISIYEIRDLLLDSEIERDRTAEVYLLKSCGVPPSYFNSVGDNHKKEIIDNAVRTYPDFMAKIYLEDNKLKAAGPAIDVDFSEVGTWIKNNLDNIQSLSGSVVDASNFRVFSSVEEEEVGQEGYCLGVDLDVLTLFCNGIKFRPMLLQIVCYNGLVKTIGNPMESVIKPLSVSMEALEYGFAATQAIMHNNPMLPLIRESEKVAARGPLQLKQELEYAKFPKSFVQKAVNLTSQIEEGQTGLGPVPSRIRTLRDNLSVMTYVAKSFNERTQFNIESYSYQWVAGVVANA